jgi:hypothetical protein
MKELNRIAIIWGLLLIGIFAMLTIFGLKWKAKTSGYFDLENKLVNVTKAYFEQGHSYPTGNSTVTITYDELKKNNQIEDLNYIGDSCTGYVTVKNNGVIQYNAYIKCSNYTTKGYQNN